MKTAWITLALATCHATAAHCSAEMPSGYYVLSIGVGKYKHPELVTELKGAVNDAENIVEVFSNQERPLRVNTLLNEQATQEGIATALEKIKEEVQPGDLVVIYLSGHGNRIAGSWAFAPYDYNPATKDPAWMTNLPGEPPASMISDADLFSCARGLCKRGHNVLIAADSCFAGRIAELAAASKLGLMRDVDDTSWSQDDLHFSKQGGIIVLASSIPSQTSLDGPGNSLFTQGLLEALNGAADWDRDGAVTLKEVKHYLSLRISELLAERPKLPGINWPEQNCVCQSSFALAETMALTAAVGLRPRLPEPLRYVNAPFGGVPETDASPVGVWQIAQPLATSDGTPLLDENGNARQVVYTLVLRPNGTYVAAFQDGRGHEQLTAGTYVFARPIPPGVLPGFKGPSGHFWLEYSNGFDRLAVETLTEEEMTITVYPNRAAIKGGTYSLRRTNAAADTP